MSILSKMRCVGVCISLLAYGNVMGMETEKMEKTENNSADDSPAWPTMAVDGTQEHPEGERLAKHHATARGRGFWKHMPKDARELERFYRLCQTSGASEGDMKNIWQGILYDMKEEIVARCLDGDLFFIDKYLGYLEEFVTLTISHPDQKFVTSLYTPYLGSLEYRLNSAVLSVLSAIESDEEKDSEYTMKSTHILYVVDRIDKILSKAMNKDSDFFNSFCKRNINTEYENTPEFKGLLEKFGRKVFGENGFVIDLKL